MLRETDASATRPWARTTSPPGPSHLVILQHLPYTHHHPAADGHHH